MKFFDARTASATIKLLVFIVVTTLSISLLVLVIGNITFSSSREYKADFVDVAGVNKGDDVRISGVRVGTVKDIEIVDRNRGRLTFTVDDQSTITDRTTATIRYRNLVGQRYLALADGIGSDAGERLPTDSVIPVSRTQPALDLTVLFNGFKPLFQALSPSDLNKLSYEVVRVFQGEGGTLEGLLGRTASLTSTLASRDKVIGSLITNLNDVLTEVGDRDTQLSALIKNFRSLVAGLRKDKDAIFDSVDGIAELTQETSGLLAGIRDPFIEDITQLRRLTGNINRNKPELDRALQVLPIKLEKIGRTATYGSWFNFFLCSFKGEVILPGNARLPIELPPSGFTLGQRCDLG